MPGCYQRLKTQKFIVRFLYLDAHLVKALFSVHQDVTWARVSRPPHDSLRANQTRHHSATQKDHPRDDSSPSHMPPHKK